MSERLLGILTGAFPKILLSGLAVTIPLTVISFSLAMLLALAAALVQFATVKMLKQMTRFYIWVFRGTPLSLISGGTFQMGSPASEPERSSDETQHSVTVGSFYRAKTEVSQGEYQSVMGNNPSETTEDKTYFIHFLTLPLAASLVSCGTGGDPETVTPPPQAANQMGSGTPPAENAGHLVFGGIQFFRQNGYSITRPRRRLFRAEPDGSYKAGAQAIQEPYIPGQRKDFSRAYKMASTSLWAPMIST